MATNVIKSAQRYQGFERHEIKNQIMIKKINQRIHSNRLFRSWFFFRYNYSENDTATCIMISSVFVGNCFSITSIPIKKDWFYLVEYVTLKIKFLAQK